MTFYAPPPDLVAINYRQNVWPGPGPTEPGMFGFGAMDVVAPEPITSALRRLEKTSKVMLDGYVSGYSVPMNIVNLRDEAEAVMSSMYSSKPKIAGGPLFDRMYSDTKRLFDSAYDSVKKDQTEIQKLQRVGSLISDVNEVTGNASALFGYERDKAIMGSLLRFYAKNMDMAAKNTEWAVGKLQQVRTIPEWNEWWAGWVEHVDRYLLPIPPTAPGWDVAFNSYRGVLKKADDIQREIKTGGLWNQLLSGLGNLILGLASTLKSAASAIWSFVEENFPNIGGALKALPWVALGIGGFVLYNYLTAPKRAIAGA